jgi:hypothetical protein
VRDDDGELARTEVRLDAEGSEFLWRLHLPMAFSTLRIRARADWEDAQGVVHEGEEEDVRGDSYVALGPYRELMKVSVQPAVDWRTATQLGVELDYEDGRTSSRTGCIPGRRWQRAQEGVRPDRTAATVCRS